MQTGISLLAMLLALRALELGAAPAEYHSNVQKSDEQAAQYEKTHGTLCRYLGFRDIPTLLHKYFRGKTALDYGAGTGSSLQFLKGRGLEVVGVDVSKEMLQKAKEQHPDVPLYLIEAGVIPCPCKSFDIVFSSFVLFELQTDAEILAYLREAKRVLKKDGLFVAVTGSQDMFSKDWLVLDVAYPENAHLESGGIGKSRIRELDMTFFDVYWTEADYRRLLKQAGFEVLETHYPKGLPDEPYQWRDEKLFSPYVIFVAR